MKEHRPLVGLTVLLVGLLMAGGCAKSDLPELGQVEGVVTLDGNPLEGAHVEFQPEAGNPSFGTTDANGHYELYFAGDTRGALLGTHTVRIRLPSPEDESQATEWKPLPPRYNIESELTATVNAGSNTIDFPLESE